MSVHPPCSRKGPFLPACGLKSPRRVKRETTNSRFFVLRGLSQISSGLLRWKLVLGHRTESFAVVQRQFTLRWPGWAAGAVPSGRASLRNGRSRGPFAKARAPPLVLARLRPRAERVPGGPHRTPRPRSAAPIGHPLASSRPLGSKIEGSVAGFRRFSRPASGTETETGWGGGPKGERKRRCEGQKEKEKRAAPAPVPPSSVVQKPQHPGFPCGPPPWY